MAQQANGQVKTDSFIPVKMSELKAHGSLLTAEMEKAYVIIVPKSLERTTSNGNPMVGTGGWAWANGLGIQVSIMHKEPKAKKEAVVPQASAIFG